MNQFLCSVLLTLAGVATTIEVGTIDQKEPPTADELREPATDNGIEVVDLRAAVTGAVGNIGNQRVYVLVNPLSNPHTRNVWWVQESVRFKDANFRGDCQFGEARQGAGEYFAVIALTTDKNYAVGQKILGLPPASAYSKLKIVKRKP